MITVPPDFNGAMPSRGQDEDVFNGNVPPLFNFLVAQPGHMRTMKAEIISLVDAANYAPSKTYNEAGWTTPDTVYGDDGLTYRCKGNDVLGDNPVGSETGNWVCIMLKAEDISEGRPTVIATVGAEDVYSTPAIFLPKIGMVFVVILPVANVGTTPTLDSVPLKWGNGTGVGSALRVGDLLKNTMYKCVAVDTDADSVADEYHIVAGGRWVSTRSTEQTGIANLVRTDIEWETNDGKNEWDSGGVLWIAPRDTIVDVFLVGMHGAGGTSPDEFARGYLLHNSTTIDSVMDYIFSTGIYLWKGTLAVSQGDTLKGQVEISSLTAGDRVFGPGTKTCEFIITERT